jgi:hypothetical protein
MDFAVAFSAQRHEILKRVVPLCLGVAESSVVDMVDSNHGAAATGNTLELVALQSVEIVPVAMSCNEVGETDAACRAMLSPGSRALCHLPANPAREGNLARWTGKVMVLLNWMKLLAASRTGFGVELRFGFPVALLADFAADLLRVVYAKCGAASDALSDFSSCFHTGNYSTTGGNK